MVARFAFTLALVLTMVALYASTKGSAEPAAKPERSSKSPIARKVNFEFTDTPLRTALDQLFSDSLESFSIDSEVPNPSLSLNIRNQPFDEALRFIVREANTQKAGIRLSREARFYRITLQGAPDLKDEKRRLPEVHPLENKLMISLKETPLRTALQLLFANQPAKFEIDEGVRDVPVTLHLRDISLDQGLRTIIRCARTLVPKLAYSRKGEVYTITSGGAIPRLD